MIVWAIANQKGGVGKTTTSVSMGGVLARNGKRVLLVDLDPHGSLTEHLGLVAGATHPTVFDLFTDKPAHIKSAIVATRFNFISVIPANLSLATVEKNLGNREGMGLVLKRALQHLESVFDYIILDCAPTVGVTMINAIAACDKFIIPTQTEHLSLHGLARMIRTLMMVSKSRQAVVPYVILPTLFDKRTRASIRTLEVMRDRYGRDVSETVIPVDTQFREASREGSPLTLVNPAARGSLAYLDFVNSLICERVDSTVAVA